MPGVGARYGEVWRAINRSHLEEDHRCLLWWRQRSRSRRVQTPKLVAVEMLELPLVRVFPVPFVFALLVIIIHARDDVIE